MKFSYSEKCNKGISLVEIIVVVAIMSILVGGATIGFSMVSGKPAQQAANMWCSDLERARTVCLGKKSSSVDLKMTTDGLFNTEIIDGDNKGSSKLSSAKVSCKVQVYNSADSLISETDITTDTDVRVMFDRTDGSLKSVVFYNTANPESGGVKTVLYDGSSISKRVVFSFKKASSTYDVTVIPVTGRVSIKKR